MQTRQELLDRAALDSNSTIAVMITKGDGVYEMEAMIPYNSMVSPDDVDILMNQMIYAFETNKTMQANLSDEQLAAVFTPVMISFSEFGESQSIASMVFKMVAPMLLSLVMYFMFLFYGQLASKSVSSKRPPSSWKHCLHRFIPMR